jgi:hypothetical protein
LIVGNKASHERFSRRCVTIRTTRWIGIEAREHPVYDDTLDLDNVLQNMEENVREDQRISVLDIALQNTLARWWATHKSILRTWDEMKQAIKSRFWNKEHLELGMQMDPHATQLFNGESDPRIHIEWCIT